MRLTLLLGIGVGLLIAGVDLLAAEAGRRVGVSDLSAGLELIDLVFNLGAFGLVGFRVAATVGELRSGLEAAVLAGIVAGCSGVVYQLARAAEPTAPENLVGLVAWNVVLAATAGSLGAWVGRMRRTAAPPH